MPAVICPFVDGRLATQYSRIIIKYCVLHVEYNCGEMAESKDKMERICQPNSRRRKMRFLLEALNSFLFLCTGVWCWGRHRVGIRPWRYPSRAHRRPCYWASNRLCLLSVQMLGRHPNSAIEIVSIYVEQVRENGLSRERVGR